MTSFSKFAHIHHGHRIHSSLAAFVLAVLCASTAAAQFGDFGGQDQEILTTREYVSVEQARPGDSVWLAVRLHLADGWHVNSAAPLQDYLIPTRLELAPSSASKVGEIVYPKGSKIPLQGEDMSVYESGATIFVPVIISSEATLGPLEFSGVLDFQGCDSRMCIAPDERHLTWQVQVAADRSEPAHPDVFAAVTTPPSNSQWKLDASTAKATATNDLERLVAKYGIWGYALTLLLAFATGLLLSFSPCTYPMIPITVSVFAGQARGMARGFMLSQLYVLTMAVIYGIMGAIVASVGGVFGAWLAHPVVVGVIVAIFVIFALSMFGLYELQVPAALRNRMAGAQGGGGVGGAIVLGAVAALVVSPCVGPFVAGILLYIATTGSAFMGFLVLFSFALGLGTLFIIIGTFSSAIQALPNAGVWMESVKRFFGFVLLLMALYFLRTLISTELTALLAGLLFLGAGVFGGGFDRLTGDAKFFPRLKKAFGVLCTLIGIYLLAGYLITSGLIWPPVHLATGGTASVGHEEKIDWVTDLDKGLAAAQSSNRPVLIDTWATWCANCHKLDRSTWSDDAVAAEAKRFVPMKLQLEKGDSPETKRFLALFGLKQYSLPTIILIDSQGRVAEIIQGYLGPAEMRQRMQAVS
jgi:thiol:disulfide interchange protein DsbD